MGFWKKVKKAATVAGKIGKNLPSTAELVYGQPKKKSKKRRR